MRHHSTASTPNGAAPLSSAASTASASSSYQETHEALAKLIAPCGVEEFFAEVWQRRPRLFPAVPPGSEFATSPSSARCGWESGESSTTGPCAGSRVIRPIQRQTWADGCEMLNRAWVAASAHSPPPGFDLLFFKDRDFSQGYDEVGPTAALLDGVSCTSNHAEFVWPPLAQLCQRLRRSLLHVYTNCYVTPAGTQAVPKHADDRDVFILQLEGCKHWLVYAHPPVKFPYTDEQVGKHGNPVPSSIAEFPPIVDCVLYPGDVLYMPRGWVHEASCSRESSWHATLAVATHDWSWSKVYTQALSAALDSEISASWRMAVPLGLGMPGIVDPSAEDTDAETVLRLEELLQLAREKVTAASLREAMQKRLLTHNRFQEKAIDAFDSSGCFLNGRASRIVGMSTRLRKATKEERAAFQMLASAPPGRCQKGGYVRDHDGGGKGGGYNGYTGGTSCGSSAFPGPPPAPPQAGSSRLRVRDEVANAVLATIAEIDRLQEVDPSRGMVVGDFRADGHGLPARW